MPRRGSTLRLRLRTIQASAETPSSAAETPQGPPPANHNVNAGGSQWSPTTVNLVAGDRVTWNFGPDAGLPHDAWVVPEP